MFETIGEGHRIMAEGQRPELDLDELERLAKAATPGPWETETYVIYARNESGNLFPVAETIRPIDFDHTYTAPKKDAAYITAACNSLPRLIEMYRQEFDEACDADKAWQNLRKDWFASVERVKALEAENAELRNELKAALERC